MSYFINFIYIANICNFVISDEITNAHVLPGANKLQIRKPVFLVKSCIIYTFCRPYDINDASVNVSCRHLVFRYTSAQDVCCSLSQRGDIFGDTKSRIADWADLSLRVQTWLGKNIGMPTTCRFLHSFFGRKRPS